MGLVHNGSDALQRKGVETMGELSPWHWAIAIGVFVVLFGAKRLPDAARSLGRSARILKAELKADATKPDELPAPAAVVTDPVDVAPEPTTAPAAVDTAPTVAPPSLEKQPQTVE
jgi:sec-independent protein translocase protein TatA